MEEALDLSFDRLLMMMMMICPGFYYQEYTSTSLLCLAIQRHYFLRTPLGNYAASNGNSLPTLRTKSRNLDGTVGYPETSVRTYHYSLRNIFSTSRRKPEIPEFLLKPNKLVLF